MYQVHMTNFGYWLGDLYPTLEAAREAGTSTGFEFSVWRGHPGLDERCVGTGCPISGWSAF